MTLAAMNIEIHGGSPQHRRAAELLRQGTTAELTTDRALAEPILSEVATALLADPALLAHFVYEAANTAATLANLAAIGDHDISAFEVYRRLIETQDAERGWQ